MANTLAYVTIFQEQLDKQAVALATSGWMEQNAGMVKYTGGDTVKIPKVTMDGMGDYSRTAGFVSGAVTLAYESMTLTQDRGRTFMLDAMDVDETNFVANASMVMSEFQRTKVIPELDAYRYSKIATLALAASKAAGGYTPAVADILSKLKADINAIQDAIGAVPLVVTMSTNTLAVLENSSEISRQLQIGQFNGAVNTEVKMVDNCPIIEVPSALLKTAFTFNDGTTAGQEAGGFVAAAGAKTINWIICPQNAPIAVSKTDNIRIFTPQQNQTADAWKIDYRKFHDLWVPDNKMAAVWVNLKEALA